MRRSRCATPAGFNTNPKTAVETSFTCADVMITDGHFIMTGSMWGEAQMEARLWIEYHAYPANAWNQCDAPWLFEPGGTVTEVLASWTFTSTFNQSGWTPVSGPLVAAARDSL